MQRVLSLLSPGDVVAGDKGGENVGCKALKRSAMPAQAAMKVAEGAAAAAGDARATVAALLVEAGTLRTERDAACVATTSEIQTWQNTQLPGVE